MLPHHSLDTVTLSQTGNSLIDGRITIGRRNSALKGVACRLKAHIPCGVLGQDAERHGRRERHRKRPAWGVVLQTPPLSLFEHREPVLALAEGADLGDRERALRSS